MIPESGGRWAVQMMFADALWETDRSVLDGHGCHRVVLRDTEVTRQAAVLCVVEWLII